MTKTDGGGGPAIDPMGLLMTVLIVSVPPMAAMFFQGTLGNFMHYSAFAGPASAPGPQGQPPGSYANTALPPGPGNPAVGTAILNTGNGLHRANVATVVATDSIKPPTAARN